jgi:predicted RNase H-like nuclease (RuvC/YqgF family)
VTSQSLAELARKEAERRKLLEREGVEGKIIRDIEARQPSNGNISTSSLPANSKKSQAQSTSTGSRASLKSYRATIEKLDREIRQSKDKLVTLRTRLETERWAPPKSGKVSASFNSDSTVERLRTQIQELEAKLKQLQRDRLQSYDAGLKAGYLPGELDGKGIMP